VIELPTESEPVKVIEGDSFRPLREIPPSTFDAVVTDPPYSSGGMVRADRTNATTDSKYTMKDSQGRRPDFAGDNQDQRAWQSWCYEWLDLCRQATRIGGCLVVFTDWRQLPALTDAIQWSGWVWRGVNVRDKTEAAKGPHLGYFGYQSEFIVWATRGPCEPKPSLAEGGEGRMPGCFRTAVAASDTHHQRGKPTDVMRWLVKCCPPQGLILDPFAGSGTTGKAAALEGRRCLLIEKEPAYAKIARDRIAKVLSAGMFDPAA
jgi:site-specific DNA-methyltransferase (adenine-specific)